MNKKYFDTRKDSLEEKINKIASEQSSITKPITDTKLTVDRKYLETKPGSLADAAVKIVSEGMDPVNKDAVKKKFDDRKDKDIDNDGDTDSSDKYLHKRRKAISKATSEEVEPCGLTAEACWDSHKQVGTKMKGGKQVPNCVPKNEAVTQDDHGEKINQDKKDAAMKKTDQKKSFDQLRKEQKLVKAGDKGKTATGKDVAMIDVEPSSRPI
jgi:hypothetical protein